MNKDLRLSFRRGDLWAIALVVFIALGTLFAFLPEQAANANPVAQVYHDGTLIRELPLDVDSSLVIEEDYCNTIVVKDGKIRISKSDCPGEDCVYSGAIASPGRSIVCLPNRVEIRISGISDVDFVVR